MMQTRGCACAAESCQLLCASSRVLALVKGINSGYHQVALYLFQLSFVLLQDPAEHEAACSNSHFVPGAHTGLRCSLVSIYTVQTPLSTVCPRIILNNVL